MGVCHESATTLHNRLPSSKLAGEISPYEALKGTPPDVSKFRVWGCVAWYYIPTPDRPHKLYPRAVPCVHLGIDESRNEYYIFIPQFNRITAAYTITFQETRFMVFSESGIASMPSNIKPLRDTEYKYRDERDVGQRKTKPTLETDTPRPLP